ncbi:MAG: hypothetical protein JRF25_13905 [Deltaproteobacteria bacterium]|nr:hypothetical protein [Deltaproteobacteria bacterium]
MTSYKLKENCPVIIGVGQCVNRPEEEFIIDDPLDFVVSSIRRAEDDSNVAGLTKEIDTLFFVNSFCL